MQKPSHPQDGGQQEQRQPQAHHQARQVASPDIGPGRQRGRHQQFVGAPVQIPRHAISCDKGQQESQHHQNCGQGMKKSSRAGSGNEAAERLLPSPPTLTPALIFSGACMAHVMRSKKPKKPRA